MRASKVCKYCRKKYYKSVNTSRATFRMRKYCSVQCAFLGVAKSRVSKAPKAHKVCENCGNTYYQRPSDSNEYFNKRRFCCLQCYLDSLPKPKPKEAKVERIAKGYVTRKSAHPIYNAWKGMRVRCTNPKLKSYKNYGGRGIKVCDSWMASFDVFLEWALENNWSKGLTLERVDVNKGYTPENCCWATRTVQGFNKRNSINLTYNNETKSAKEWAQFCGMSYGGFVKRLKTWKDINRIIEERVHVEFRNN